MIAVHARGLFPDAVQKTVNRNTTGHIAVISLLGVSVALTPRNLLVKRMGHAENARISEHSKSLECCFNSEVGLFPSDHPHAIYS